LEVLNTTYGGILIKLYYILWYIFSLSHMLNSYRKLNISISFFWECVCA